MHGIDTLSIAVALVVYKIVVIEEWSMVGDYVGNYIQMFIHIGKVERCAPGERLPAECLSFVRA